jgi:uncharacterized lipoprotein YehR (DUF1307 family)
MKKKNLINLILAAVIMIGMVAACDKEKDNGNGN